MYFFQIVPTMKYSTLQQIPKNEAIMSGKKCNVSTVSWQKRYARTFYLKDPIVRKRVGTPDQPTIEEGSEHHAM